jgi:hypothetical protein
VYSAEARQVIVFAKSSVNLIIDYGSTVKEAQDMSRHITPDMTINTYARARKERLIDAAEEVGESINPAFNITYPEPENGYQERNVKPAACMVSPTGFEPVLPD